MLYSPNCSAAAGRNSGLVAQVTIVPDEALRPSSNALWELGCVRLQRVWGMAQVGTSRNLRIQVHVRNDFSGTSLNKATVLEGLEHGTHH